MSPVSSDGKIILVSGINGYIGAHVGLQVLEAGYSLRGTSRSAHSAEPLLKGAYKDYADRVELVSVPDMTVGGAFDEAVKGVTAVIHVASPVNFSLKTWDEFYSPAYHGAIGMLESALAHAGPQLEIVVLTSSIAAVSSPDKNKAGHHYTEADFNDWAEPLAKSENPPNGVFYTASKAASEKAFWKFRDDKKPFFAMTAVNPSVVTGPPINPPSEASGLNETLRPAWNLLSGSLSEIPPNIGTAGCIDVRDVATVHVWCATHPAEAANHRFFTTAGRGTNQAAADILRKAYPDRAEVIPKGEPGSDYEADYGFLRDGPSYENEMAKKAVGGEFIRYDQSIRDSAKALERYL